jgi:hypothetical protein
MNFWVATSVLGRQATVGNSCSFLIITSRLRAMAPACAEPVATLEHFLAFITLHRQLRVTAAGPRQVEHFGVATTGALWVAARDPRAPKLLLSAGRKVAINSDA